MDTKSRRISRSVWVKLLAVVLALAGALLAAHGLLELPSFPLAADQKLYSDSEAKEKLLSSAYDWVLQIATYYQNEEYILSGASSADQLAAYTDSRIEQFNEAADKIYENYSVWVSTASNASEAERLSSERDKRLEQERERKDRDIAHYRSSLIDQHLSQYRVLLEQLTGPGAFIYHATPKDKPVFSNVGEPDIEGLFATQGAFKAGKLTDGTSVYAGVPNIRYAELMDEYDENRYRGINGIYQAVSGLLLFLVGFGYTVYAAGRRPEHAAVHLVAIDRIYLDISLAAIGAAVCFVAVAIGETFESAISTGSQVTINLGAMLVIILALLLLLAGGMVSRRIKRGELIKHTLSFAVLSSVWNCARARVRLLLEAGPAGLRLALCQGTFAVLIAISVLMVAESRGGATTAFGFMLFLVTNGAALFFLLRKAKGLQTIAAGVERIRGGDLAYRMSEPSGGMLGSLAQSVNEIALGLETAVANEVKSERLKTELITNVSHDLKTPLTSLITYVDLLKTEGLDSEYAAKYLDVLDRKSQRLKSLTEDLFEAAKAASGSIAVNLERLDADSLLNQGLGELADRIDASGLDFRITIAKERLYVRADGRLLWRVIENLLQNVFKYALPGSRVYVDANQQAGKVKITVKNISACALNIDPEELMERFKRGDESRHSEGSGLGLAIARSLTELQGGEFRIEIDGDLFKATVSLPQAD